MRKKLQRIIKPKYIIEFLSMFIAVVAAFALNNWNENRRDVLAENKILLEINNGLKLDLKDIKSNLKFHKRSFNSIGYFRSFFINDTIKQDSTSIKYILLFREPALIINRSGYESLKNKGLEIIQNDSLRFKITRLYENDYQFLSKFEDDIPEMQTYYYYETVNSVLLKYYEYDENGRFIRLNEDIKPSKTEVNEVVIALWNMEFNIRSIANSYNEINVKVKELVKEIDTELKERW